MKYQKSKRRKKETGKFQKNEKSKTYFCNVTRNFYNLPLVGLLLLELAPCPVLCYSLDHWKPCWLLVLCSYCYFDFNFLVEEEEKRTKKKQPGMLFLKLQDMLGCWQAGGQAGRQLFFPYLRGIGFQEDFWPKKKTGLLRLVLVKLFHCRIYLQFPFFIFDMQFHSM